MPSACRAPVRPGSGPPPPGEPASTTTIPTGNAFAPVGSAIASTRRRTSGTVGGISPGSRPPFYASFLFDGGLARDDQEGVGQQAEGYVAVPGVPLPHLVVVQADLALGLREALLHRPTILARPHQLLDRRPFRAVGLEEAGLVRVVGAPADEQPAAHPLRPIRSSSRHAHSHGRRPPPGPARAAPPRSRFAQTLDELPILFLRPPSGTALVFGTITA